MKINFAMWKTALGSLVKMEKKEEWDGLDVVSKWLIATRSAVTTVTIFSCVIAGLLAWRDLASSGGRFDFVTWLIVALGLFLAHGTNNLLNDYTDFKRGVDVGNYFRTQYGVHPLVQGFWQKPQQLRWFVVSGTMASLAGVYALWRTNFDPLVIGLFALGALVLFLYTWPLKYLALGELSIFLIWGPIMIGAVYYVLTRTWSWPVVLAAVPFGLSVATINLGKHIDKLEMDKPKRVFTLPVVIGQKSARLLDMLALVSIYGVILYLVFGSHYFTPILLMVFFAARRGLMALAVLSKPRPAEPPREYPAWPTWFSGFTFYHNRLFGGLFILGLILDTVLRVYFPSFVGRFWPLV